LRYRAILWIGVSLRISAAAWRGFLLGEIGRGCEIPLDAFAVGGGAPWLIFQKRWT
jgi:hypothetical protein